MQIELAQTRYNKSCAATSKIGFKTYKNFDDRLEIKTTKNPSIIYVLIRAYVNV